MTSKTTLYISLVILGIVIVLFSAGSSILTTKVFGIPAGNLIIWLGFIALQFATYALNKGFRKQKTVLGKVIRTVMILLIIISILWFGIAYVLSGNTSFNFSSRNTTYQGSPRASILYWNIIYTLIIAPVVLSLLHNMLRYFKSRKTQN
jgi:hypothetical protein